MSHYAVTSLTLANVLTRMISVTRDSIARSIIYDIIARLDIIGT